MINRLTIVVLLSLIIPSLIFSLSVGFKTGPVFPLKGDKTLNIGYNIGGTLVFPLGDYFVLKGDYSLIRGNRETNGHYSLMPLTAGGVFTIPVNDAIKPYISFSAGYVRCANMPGTNSVQNKFYLSPNGGVMFFLNRDYPLFLDVGFSYFRFTTTDITGGENPFSGITLNIGFGYNL
jgi:hypothetical protein